ncbi:RluA family pseudouridine synthase [bacterium]|nr:RluA family pseudouridine synthase [bacterium]
MKTPTKFQVVYEDNHLIVVNKKSGVLVQGDRTGDEPLSEMVKKYLKEKYRKPGDVFCGVLHRLDRPVSGLVMLAKTSKGLTKMNDLFRRRVVRKTYWAITNRRPDEMAGDLTHWLIKDPKRNRTQAYNKPCDTAQKAELNYRILGTLNRHWLMEIMPITGRPHQIRAQLAAIGCPIIGDVKYGYATPNPDASIHLHARRLRFEHPIKREPVDLEGTLPNDRLWRQFSLFEKSVD